MHSTYGRIAAIRGDLVRALRAAAALLLIPALGACGGGSESSSADPGVTVPAQSRDGKVYRQVITPSTGDAVVFQVMEPTKLDAGHTYPLVLQGHGYGGSRNLAPTTFEQRLRDAGYYVISIDQRGFGESSGTIRVMDPEYEGVDLVGILDWAENLEGLRRRADGSMVVGSFGGSYGGMYQVLLWAVDPKHRLRVLAPDITPHDLTFALQPNGVVKSGWGLVLSAGGETGNANYANALASGDQATIQAALSTPPPHQDKAIYETLVQAALTGRFPDAGLAFFKYHSFGYYCDGAPAQAQGFLLATPDQLTVPPVAPPPADVLLTQGIRDSLFNFNDGFHNYQCMKALGGDVRLFSHQTGHLLPVAAPDAVLGPLDPFFAALTVPSFQAAGGTRSCGDVDLDDLTFAWFEEKLQRKSGAVAAVLGGDSHDVCMSLAEGDAIDVADVKVGGQAFAIDGSIPQFSAALGTAVSLLGTGAREALLANQALMTAPAGGAIIAGVPTLHLDIEGVSGAEMGDCALPVSAGCDPILFLAIGRRAAGQTRWELIDDEITPVRGFGVHDLQMNGVAARLAEGDEVSLLIYGFHAQFPVSWSRDVFVPAVKLSGSLALPVLTGAEVLRTRARPAAP